MGWRGTVRTLGAMARQAERDAMRRSRDNARHLAAMEKLDAKAQAAAAVREHEEYLQRLISIHSTCSVSTDWHSRANEPAPREPRYSAKNESDARLAMELYKPSFLSRLFGQIENQKRKLSDAMDAGKRKDEQLFSQESAKYPQELADHQEQVAFSQRVLKADPEALLEAVKLFEPLSSIGLLGEHMQLTVPKPNVLAIELAVHSEDVVPKERAKLLVSGRASVKPMPKGEYYRLYQDHVCSAGLRVARELLALLPIEEVIVTAVDDLLDPSTGHLKRSAILSFRAPRQTISQLNFHAIDPSDAMRNFVHNMSFTPTNGFKKVEQLVI